MPRLAPEGPGARPGRSRHGLPRPRRGSSGSSAGRGCGPGSRGRGAGLRPHQGRGPGPHPWPSKAPRDPVGRRARGTGRPPVGGIQRWAWGSGNDGVPGLRTGGGQPQDPEVHFRGRRSPARVPCRCRPGGGRGGRKTEPRASNLRRRMRPVDPARTRKREKKNTAGKSAQAQSAGWKGGRGAETRKCLLRVRRIQIRGVKKERYLCACVHPAWPALSPGSAPPEDHPYPDVTSVAFSPPRAASPSGPALRPRVSRSALRNRQK